MGSGNPVAGWRAKVSAARNRIPAPELKRSREAPGRVTARGKELADQRAAARPDYHGEAQKAVPPPPKVENPPPSAEQVIEKTARDQVAATTHNRLSDQTLPPLERSPGYPGLNNGQGRLPDLTPPAPAPVKPPAGATAGAAAPPTAAGEAGSKTKAEVEAKANQPPAGPVPATPPPPVTLHDQGVPPPKPVPEGAKADMTGSLALVLAGAESEATQFTSQAEEAAYPKGALKRVAPNIAKDQVGPEKRSIDAELHGIAAAAGIEGRALDAKVKALGDAAKAQAADALKSLDAASAGAKAQVQGVGESQRAAIKGAGEAARKTVDNRSEAAGVTPDPKEIEATEKRIVDVVTRDAAAARAAYRKALEIRLDALARGVAQQIAAYQRTAKQEADEIRELTKENYNFGRFWWRNTLDWGERHTLALHNFETWSRAFATGQTDAFRDTVNDAENRALEAVHGWADTRLHRERSFWQRLFELFAKWSRRAKADTAAWEALRDRESADQMAADFATIVKLREVAAKQNPEELKAAVEGLTKEQQLLLTTFFTAGGDAVTAVAAAVLARMQSRRVPALTEQFRQTALDTLGWEDLDALGRAQDPGFDARALAGQVRSAVKGWGTKESKLFAAIGKRTPVQMAAMKAAYKATYNRDLYDDVDDDLSGDEWKRAKAAMAGDATGEDVFTLHDAFGVFNNDEAAIMATLRNKTPAEREAILVRYRQEYGIDLHDHLRKELRDPEDLTRAEALLDGDTVTADAIGLKQSTHSKWYGGSDIKDLDAIYAQIRKEVESDAAKKNMTTAEVEAEVVRRSRDVEGHYETQFGGGKPGAMREAFKDAFRGGEEDLALALADNDRTAQDAARIRMESTDLLYTSDEKVLAILRAQRERAETEVRRDTLVKFKILAAKEKWPPDVAKRKWDEMNREAEKEIDARSRKNMKALETTYDERYSKGWGPGTLTAVVELQMSGNEREMARALRQQGGKLSPAQEVYWAVDGLGTNEELLRRALRGKTKAELNAMREEYRKAHPGRELDEDVMGDVSGRDAFDFGQMLQGEPETPEERQRRNHARRDYELGSGSGFGSLLADDEADVLKNTTNEADRAYLDYQKAVKEHGKDSEEAKAKLERFERWSGYNELAVGEYREAVDTVTDHLAMAAAVVVGLVVAVATAGTASPAVVAAISALAATEASITVKIAMKGHSYGIEDLGVDAAIGAVDVAAAALTAGVGNALLRTNLLARLSEEQLLSRLARQGIAHGTSGMLAGLPSGAVGQLINDDLWRGDEPLKAFLLGMLQNAGSGFAMGAGMSAIHAWKAPVPESHPSSSSRSGSPHVDPASVPKTPPAPEATAHAKAAVEAHPPTALDAQLKAATHPEDVPHAPGTTEAKAAADATRAKAALDPSRPESTSTGTDRSAAGGSHDPTPRVTDPARGTTYVEPGSPEYHALMHEGWTAEMLRGGLGRFEPAAVPTGPEIKPGVFKEGIRTPEQAYHAYNEAMARSGGREVGIFQNLDTGEYVVKVGSKTGIFYPGERFRSVLHYHPNEGNVLNFRNPSIQDVHNTLRASMRQGRPVTEFIEYPLPEGGRGRTGYTVEPNGRVTVEYVDEHGRRVAKVYDTPSAFDTDWGQRKVFVAPEIPGPDGRMMPNPEYEALLHDADMLYSRERASRAGSATAEPLPDESSMAGRQRGKPAASGETPTKKVDPARIATDYAEYRKKGGVMPFEEYSKLREQGVNIVRGDPAGPVATHPETHEIVSAAESIVPDPSDPYIGTLRATQGTARELPFRTEILPDLKGRAPEGTVFGVLDREALKARLGLSELPWDPAPGKGGAPGVDMFLVKTDPVSGLGSVAPIDMIDSYSPDYQKSHLAAKQAQVNGLRKLLPGWTIEPPRDFNVGKVRVSGKAMNAELWRQLGDVLKRYGVKPP